MQLAVDTFPKERFGLVTGSRCSPLVPKKNAKAGMVTLAKELAKEKYFQHYDEFYDWQTEHGKMCQQFAFEHFVRYHDATIEQGKFGFDGDVGWSPDAEASTYGVDFKCPTSLEKFLSYLTDGISKGEFDQCQHYMMNTKKDTWLICAFLMETQRMSDNGLRYPLSEENRSIIVEVKAQNEWREKFNSNLPFVVSTRNEFIEMYKLKFK